MDKKRIVPVTADIFINENGAVVFADLTEELETVAQKLGVIIDVDEQS